MGLWWVLVLTRCLATAGKYLWGRGTDARQLAPGAWGRTTANRLPLTSPQLREGLERTQLKRRWKTRTTAQGSQHLKPQPRSELLATETEFLCVRKRLWRPQIPAGPPFLTPHASGCFSLMAVANEIVKTGMGKVWSYAFPVIPSAYPRSILLYIA